MRLNVYTARERLWHVWYVSTQMRHVVESDHHVVRLERALSDSVVVRCMHACMRRHVRCMCMLCMCCAYVHVRDMHMHMYMCDVCACEGYDVSGTFRLRTSVIMLQSLSPRP